MLATCIGAYALVAGSWSSRRFEENAPLFFLALGLAPALMAPLLRMRLGTCEPRSASGRGSPGRDAMEKGPRPRGGAEACGACCMALIVNATSRPVPRAGAGRGGTRGDAFLLASGLERFSLRGSVGGSGCVVCLVSLLLVSEKPSFTLSARVYARLPALPAHVKMALLCCCPKL